MKVPKFTPIAPSGTAVVGIDMAVDDVIEQALSGGWHCGTCGQDFEGPLPFQRHGDRFLRSGDEMQSVYSDCEDKAEARAMGARGMRRVALAGLDKLKPSKRATLLRYLGALGAIEIGVAGRYAWRELAPYMVTAAGAIAADVVARACLLSTDQTFAAVHELLVPICEDSGSDEGFVEAVNSRCPGLVTRLRERHKDASLAGAYVADDVTGLQFLLDGDELGDGVVHHRLLKMALAERKKRR